MNRYQVLTFAVALSSFCSGGPQPSFATEDKSQQIREVASAGFPWISLKTEDTTRRTPEPGSTESSAGPGEAIYTERHQTSLVLMTNYAVLSEEFVLEGRKGVRLPAGTVLENFLLTFPGKPPVYMRCSPEHTSVKQTLLSGPIYKSAVCFQEGKGFLVPYFFKGYKTPDGVRIKHELRDAQLDSTTQPEGTFELLYQGVGGGVLKLTYREFTANDLARPAFTQEVVYDVEPDGPTEILFKGAKITVLSASNTELRYRVETAFKL